MSKLNNIGNQIDDREEIEKIAEAIRSHDAEWIQQFKELIEIVKSCSHDQVTALIEILRTGSGLIEIPTNDDKALTFAGIEPERVREEEQKRGMTADSVIIDSEGRKRITWNFE